jgi:hypothetical protein
MGICEEIAAARRCGKVRCGIRSEPAASVIELAGAFGLMPDADYYREIDRKMARLVLARLIGRDMAYDKEVVPSGLAKELASRFIAQFDPAARYFTNGEWHRPDAGSLGWEAVTSATFDGGVLVLAASSSGCLWVEDED